MPSMFCFLLQDISLITQHGKVSQLYMAMIPTSNRNNISSFSMFSSSQVTIFSSSRRICTCCCKSATSSQDRGTKSRTPRPRPERSFTRSGRVSAPAIRLGAGTSVTLWSVASGRSQLEQNVKIRAKRNVSDFSVEIAGLRNGEKVLSPPGKVHVALLWILGGVSSWFLGPWAVSSSDTSLHISCELGGVCESLCH